MPKISLITPTRNRPNDLKTFLKSVYETTTNHVDVEILFFVDDDDETTLKMIDPLIETYHTRLDLHFIIGKRSDHFSKDYYNFLAKKAKGRWIMAINDDSVFVTPGWDVIVCNKMEAAADKMGDDILLGIVQDGMIRNEKESKAPTMSCWLLSSKEYVDLMGGLLLEEIYTWGGDYWLGRLFTKVQGGRRKVYILDVLIEHNSHHMNPKKDPKDHIPQPESFAHFQRIERAHPCMFNENELRNKLIKITQYIAGKK